jgi:hypothetical protein
VINAKYGPAGNLLTALEISVDEIVVTSSGKSFVWHTSEEVDATMTTFANAALQTSSLEAKAPSVLSYVVFKSSEDAVIIKVIGTMTVPDVAIYAFPEKSKETCVCEPPNLPKSGSLPLVY